MTKSKPLGKGLGALIRDNRTPRSASSPEGAQATGAGTPRRLPLADVRPNPDQPRREMDPEALQELADSIRENGVLQPVIVFEDGGGYVLIAGERRYRASIQAGQTTIPAILRDKPDEQELMRLALIENIQREDLNPLDLASAYRNLMDEHGMTQEELGKALAISRSGITNILRLLKLPAVIKLSLKGGEISVGHAKVLLGLSSDDDKVSLWRRCLKRQLSVRQLEQLASRLKEGERPAAEKPRVEKPFEILDAEDRMRSSLGTQVRITPKRKGGQIEIEYYSDEELDRLLEFLDR